MMRKGYDNDWKTAMMWAPEGCQRQDRHRTSWIRIAENSIL